jgi:hypothetical protein
LWISDTRFPSVLRYTKCVKLLRDYGGSATSVFQKKNQATSGSFDFDKTASELTYGAGFRRSCLMSNILSDRSTCRLKLKQYRSCIQDCIKSLELYFNSTDTNSINNTMNRCEALLGLKKFQEAEKSLDEVHDYDSDQQEPVPMQRVR